ncbi:MAG: low molecular weight phosphotyrosine protein phosphatase [Uliginosibacterium sp.]|nr:low molecular weight phosphotyrosine protein phosphatase [Uliginosibacterium sp.]
MRILFVCTGNICRSPTADGVARHLAAKHRLEQFEFDSAGTHAYHTGEAPDGRTLRAARRRGYDLSKLRARPVQAEDFEVFDLILAMDKGHLVWLQRECPPAFRHKLALFLSYSLRWTGEDLPDPYYGESADFERVLDMCEETLPRVLGLA